MQIQRVWFVSHYSMPPEYEMRIKTQMYAHYLGERGIECTIFSASTIHNSDINLIEKDVPYIEKEYGDLKFVHIRCSNYHGNGYSRIKNMLQFSLRFYKVASNFSAPDVIVADVNCINYQGVYYYCKSHNIPLYIDVRDLWPESIVEYLNYKRGNPIIRYLYCKEHQMYKRVDGIIFSMEGGIQYIRDKNWKDIDEKKIYYINNGVDLKAFESSIDKYIIEDSDLIDKDKFKVVYTGSIRTANNVQAIVDAAKLLSDSNVEFLIYGDGDQKETLQRYCDNNNIANVKFKGKVDKDYIPYILSKCDVTILIYKQVETWKYGGSQNKLFEYLAAGKPILLAVDMNYNLVEKNHCGLTISNPNPELIASAIMELKGLSRNQLLEMGDRSKRVAQAFDYEELSLRLLSIINK